MTSQSVTCRRAPLTDVSVDATDALVGFQIAVSRGHRVVVLDLLNHPCARHILDDVAQAGASGSIAELVARITGAELVAGVTSEELLRSSCVVDPAPLRVAAATSEPAVVSAAVAPTVLKFRERAVLELVTAGYTNREIADRLGLSISSISASIRDAYRKIDVTTRAEAVRWGLHHGAGC